MTFKTGNYRTSPSEPGEVIPLSQVLPTGYEFRRAMTGQLQLWRVDVNPETILTEQDVGILDVNGSIRAAVNTLYLEQAHAITSSGEEIAFKNLETGVNYMPGWAGATPGGVNVTPLGGIVEGALNTTFEPGGTLLTTGAVDAEFTSVITANATFYATYYLSAEDYAGPLSLIVKDSRNEVVFKFDLPSAAYVLDTPISLPDIFYRVRIGNTRTIGIYKDNGDPLLVRPGSLDNTKPYRKYSVRPFNDRRVIVVGADGKVPLSDLPDLSTSIVLAVNTEAERLALTAANKLYIVTQATAGPGSPGGYQWFLNPNLDPSVLANWVQGANVGSTVSSFNGRTGTVIPAVGDYTPAEVGAVALPGADSVRRVLIGNTPTQENLVNDLNSTSSTAVLSAAQGKILNDSKQATVTGAATSILNSDLTAFRVVITDAAGKVAISTVTDTELGRLSGITSNVQTQLNAKQATITGAATTVLTSNLTVSRAMVSDASGKIAISSVTDVELGMLSGVRSNVQDQLDLYICSAVALWQANGAGSTTVSSYGGSFNTNGTVGSSSMANTSYGRIRKVTYSVASSGTIAGVTGPAAYDTETGFNFCATWGLDSGLTSHTRAFIGLKSTSFGNSDIATQTNLIGIGFNPSESNYSTIQNDGSGSGVKTDLGANFPAGSAGSNMFRFEMLCEPGSTTITWKLTRVAGGTSQVTQGTFSTSDLPAAGTFLTPQVSLMTTSASTTKVAVSKLAIQTKA